MSLECLNNIIYDDLAIHIDISSLQSWNRNTGLTLVSLIKLNNAISNDLNLPDFGLTGYDNGFLNSMLSGFTLTATDNLFKLYRVGYNSGGTTIFSGLSITSISGSSVGAYFYLNGGFLQGFHKLEGYDFELLPPRFNRGITIETMLEILPQSQGIFFLMGTRAEDKYNPYFSGETVITGETAVVNATGGTNYQYGFSGITTSEGNYLNAYVTENIVKSSFSQPELLRIPIQKQYNQLDNIKNNVIAFELTSDKRLAYKYIDGNGLLKYNFSPRTITRTGWCLIDVVFTPDEEIEDYDPTMYRCYTRRNGTLTFYLNGRSFWTVENFTEWYSSPIYNDKEKQLGVPFNISWGGGSFGLKHSWHFSSGDTSAPYVQDERKDSLFIEDYFSSTYIGNIQKLRIYDNALTPDKILHNTLIEIERNSYYDILVNKGGRIIYQTVSRINLEQEVAGSDIRKSIKYRNADGSYRNLWDMDDIKVVVKSKSNPTVELIKFKKVVESGWTGLIYVDNYTYDFIVPDEITSTVPNQVLFAEIKFEWTDPNDIDNLFEKIFIVDITATPLTDNTVKYY